MTIGRQAINKWTKQFEEMHAKNLKKDKLDLAAIKTQYQKILDQLDRIELNESMGYFLKSWVAHEHARLFFKNENSFLYDKHRYNISRSVSKLLDIDTSSPLEKIEEQLKNSADLNERLLLKHILDEYIFQQALSICQQAQWNINQLNSHDEMAKARINTILSSVKNIPYVDQTLVKISVINETQLKYLLKKRLRQSSDEHLPPLDITLNTQRKSTVADIPQITSTRWERFKKIWNKLPTWKKFAFFTAGTVLIISVAATGVGLAVEGGGIIAAVSGGLTLLNIGMIGSTFPKTSNENAIPKALVIQITPLKALLDGAKYADINHKLATRTSTETYKQWNQIIKDDFCHEIKPQQVFFINGRRFTEIPTLINCFEIFTQINHMEPQHTSEAWPFKTDQALHLFLNEQLLYQYDKKEYSSEESSYSDLSQRRQEQLKKLSNMAGLNGMLGILSDSIQHQMNKEITQLSSTHPAAIALGINEELAFAEKKEQKSTFKATPTFHKTIHLDACETGFTVKEHCHLTELHLASRQPKVMRSSTAFISAECEFKINFSHADTQYASDENNKQFIITSTQPLVSYPQAMTSNKKSAIAELMQDDRAVVIPQEEKLDPQSPRGRLLPPTLPVIDYGSTKHNVPEPIEMTRRQPSP